VRLERETEFWEIDLDDRVATIRTGRIGTRGKTQRLTAESSDDAQRLHDDAVAGALVKGFREPPGPPPPAGLAIRDAALEQALRDHRDDRDAYLVYADWLQAAGNPLGELIVAEARRGGRNPKLEKRIDALRGVLRLPLPDCVRFGWRFGMWRTLRIENVRELRGGQVSRFAAAAIARDVFSHAMCAALDELHVGALQWRENHVRVPEIITEAQRHAWARGLRRLVIGDIIAEPEAQPYLAGYDPGQIGALVAATFPDLRALRVHAGFTADVARILDGLHMPELRELALVVGRFAAQRVDQLYAAKLPRLERLELWLGEPNRNARAVSTIELRPLFAGAYLREVRHLALRNSPNATAFAQAIVAAPIASRLVTLDLSKGTLDDVGADALVAGAPKLPHLERLVLDESYLTPAAIRLLGTRFGARVSALDQKPEVAAGARTVSFVQPGLLRRRR
jgi:uncharacterized protein (TIGR02996 family)